MTDPAVFASWYREREDPWQLAERWYDRRRYALLMAALPRQTYRRAYEPACSVGELTRALAGRCAEVVATDAVPEAVAVAGRRTAGLPGVRVGTARLGVDPWPAGSFDLVVLSEVGYYLDPPSWRRVIAEAGDHVEAGGTLLLGHWRHPATEHVQPAEQVHAAVAEHPDTWRALASWSDADLLLDVWLREPGGPRSVAAAEGLA